MRFARLTLLTLLSVHASVALAADAPLTFEGQQGPGRGKRVVLISGDEEYRSEEVLPALAKILAQRHGFTCTVLFAIDRQDGTINPNQNDNIPGLEALDDADLAVFFIRWRNLPDEQMAPIARYVASGRPIIGFRTATHCFKLDGETYAPFTWNSQTWDGGFGRQVLGETWVSHHGKHGKQSTRGLIAPGMENHPILRGVAPDSMWGPTDVYGVKLPLPRDSRPLVLGQVLDGMTPDSPPAAGAVNDPMMPVAWVKTYQPTSFAKSVRAEKEGAGRVFTCTMMAGEDFASEGLRRLAVNACYWAVGLENEIPAESNVDFVGDYVALPFKKDGYRKNMKPADHSLSAAR